MNALLKLIITVFFVAALLWLAFANRDSVTVSWSPLHEPITLPLAVIILGVTFAGFLWGALIVWLNGAELRRDRRRKGKDVARLERELREKDLHGAQTQAMTAAPTFLP